MTDFITEPMVKLISRPVVDIDGLTSFLDAHDVSWPEFQKKLDSNLDLGDRDAEYIPEMAGRVCYMSFPKKDGESKGRTHEEHIKHLIEIGHFSCVEHCNFGFVLWNISRSLTHELVRHRLASYSQLSQRYVDSSEVKFIIPPAIQELEKQNPNHPVINKWKESCLNSRLLYEEITESLSELYKDIPDKTEKRKKAREAARSVLPNATETKIFVTMNTRSLRHFLSLRANAAADREIRLLAVKIYKIMQQEFPLLMHGIDLIKLPDGTEAVQNSFRET
jgi:thymidylate synthase (FAD)